MRCYAEKKKRQGKDRIGQERRGEGSTQRGGTGRDRRGRARGEGRREGELSWRRGDQLKTEKAFECRVG